MSQHCRLSVPALPLLALKAKAALHLSTDFSFLFGHGTKKRNVFSRAVPLLTVTSKPDKTPILKADVLFDSSFFIFIFFTPAGCYFRTTEETSLLLRVVLVPPLLLFQHSIRGQW